MWATRMFRTTPSLMTLTDQSSVASSNCGFGSIVELSQTFNSIICDERKSAQNRRRNEGEREATYTGVRLHKVRELVLGNVGRELRGVGQVREVVSVNGIVESEGVVTL